jgi:hypothetical protein
MNSVAKAESVRGEPEVIFTLFAMYQRNTEALCIRA